MRNEKTLKNLKNIGLDEKQTKVYLASLELGTATIQELSDKSGIKRTSIYNFIDFLIEKDLIYKTKQNNKIYFTAENPQALKDLIKEQASKIENILPDLLNLFHVSPLKPSIRYYKGIDGIKKIYEDTLATNQPIYAFTDVESMIPLMGKWLWDWYPNQRVKKNIKIYSIAKEGLLARKAMQRNSIQNREMKIIQNVNFDTEINIYGSKVAMISFQRPYIGVIIEDISINQTLKSVWQVVWSKL